MNINVILKDRRIYFNDKKNPRIIKTLGFGSTKSDLEWIFTEMTIVYDGGDVSVTDSKGILFFEKISKSFYNENYKIYSKGVGETEILITLNKDGISKTVSEKFEVKP